MSKKSTFTFEGTRAQFQRYRDARPFHGWVERFFGSQIVINTTTDRAVEIGDAFRIELNSYLCSAVINAELVRVLDYDTESFAYARMIEAGSSSQLVVALSTPLELRILGPTQYAPPIQDTRYNRVGRIRVEINFEGEAITGIVSDVSKSGLGVLVERSYHPGDELALEVHTELGLVHANAEVAYCIRSIELEGHFRIGLRFAEMSRMDGPRWMRLIREISGN